MHSSGTVFHLTLCSSCLELCLFIRKCPWWSERLSKRQPSFTEILGELAGGGKSFSSSRDKVGWQQGSLDTGQQKAPPSGTCTWLWIIHFLAKTPKGLPLLSSEDSGCTFENYFSLCHWLAGCMLHVKLPLPQTKPSDFPFSSFWKRHWMVWLYIPGSFHFSKTRLFSCLWNSESGVMVGKHFRTLIAPLTG